MNTLRRVCLEVAWSFGFRFGAPTWDRMRALGIAEPARATWREVDSAKRRDLARELDLPDSAPWALLHAALKVDNARLKRRCARGDAAAREAAERHRRWMCGLLGIPDDTPYDEAKVVYARWQRQTDGIYDLDRPLSSYR